MKIAVDKKSLNAIKQDGNEYIYLFDDENIEELLKLKLHCVHYMRIRYVDINLSRFKVDCIKNAKIDEKDYDKLPDKRDYKFAIIIPNFNNDHGDYNGKSYLKNCIESILNQTYKKFNIVFIDDMSTDTSVKTIKEYKDKRIHILENKRKRYNGGSRNVGIEYALDNLDFDYFCFLDSDDWWKHNEVLEHINEKLYNHELMTIGCEMIFKTNVSTPVYNKPDVYQDLYSLNGKVWCTAWARVIKKEKIKYFCENTLMEDRVWTYKIADNVNFQNVTNLKEVCYCWNRMNTENSVSLVRSDFWDACAYCHIGHQLQFLTEIKHKEMIPILKNRIKECIAKVNSGEFKQH